DRSRGLAREEGVVANVHVKGLGANGKNGMSKSQTKPSRLGRRWGRLQSEYVIRGVGARLGQKVQSVA
ncbi:hypothetical protein PMI21_00571, partial [Pseudomonas sp. GM18]|uniref:hypothetical protein n=1 Tax=Pseudomonas sp. GM18 TaxID=1144324 RepID=UPI0002726B5C